MAWTFVNGAEVATSTNSQTIAKPAGVAVGDALVYTTRTNTTQFAASTGGLFTEISQTSMGNARIQMWFRVVDGSEGATFGFTTTGTASTFFITGLAVRPPASTPLVDVYSIASNASATALCAPSITTTTNDECLIWSSMINSTGTGYTPPTGFTTPAGADIVSTFRLLMAYNLSQGVGATGDLVGTVTSSVLNATGVVALRMLNPPIIGSDASTLAETDSVSIAATATISDSDTVSVTETVASSSILAMADSGTVGATENAAPVITFQTLTASDSGTVAVTETAVVSSALASSDSGTISATENATPFATFQSIFASESVAISAAESATPVTVLQTLTVSDSGTIAASESAVIGPPSAEFVGARTTTILTGSTITLPVPPGTRDDDFVVINLIGQAAGGPNSWLVPPEWTLIGDYSAGIAAGCWVFIASGLGSTITISFSGSFTSTGAAGIIASYRAPAGLFLALDASSNRFHSAATTLSSPPSVTTTQPTDLLIHATMTWSNAVVSAPTGFMLPGTAALSSARSGAISHNLDAGAAGATGVISAPISNAQTAHAYLIAVRISQPAPIAVPSTDSGTITASESASLFAFQALTASDSGTISRTETASTSSVIQPPSDTGTISSSETATIFQALSVSDSGTLNASESASIVAMVAPKRPRPPRVVEVQSTFAAASTVVVTRGPLTQDGDRLVAHLFSFTPGVAAFTAPAGWSSLTPREGGASFRGQLWSSPATTGTTSWSFTDTAGSSAFRVTVVTIRDVNPVSLFATTQTSISNSADPDWYAGGYTLPANPSFTVEFGAATVPAVTFDPVPSAYLPEIAEFTTGISVVVAGRANAAPGFSTAELTATPGSAGGIWTIVLAADPANQDASDYAIVLASEALALSVSVFSADSDTIGAIESASVVGDVSPITGSDAGTIVASESQSIISGVVPVTASDSGTIVSAESQSVAVGVVPVASSDSGTISDVESPGILTVVTVSDSDTITDIETFLNTVAISRSDMATIITTPGIFSLVVCLSAPYDTGLIGAVEFVNILSPQFTGFSAYESCGIIALRPSLFVAHIRERVPLTIVERLRPVFAGATDAMRDDTIRGTLHARPGPLATNNDRPPMTTARIKRRVSCPT